MEELAAGQLSADSTYCKCATCEELIDVAGLAEILSTDSPCPECEETLLGWCCEVCCARSANGGMIDWYVQLIHMLVLHT